MVTSGRLNTSLTEHLLQKGYIVHVALQKHGESQLGKISCDKKKLKVFNLDMFDYQSILYTLKGLVGQRVGNGSGFSYDGGNNLAANLDPGPFGFGALDPRVQSGTMCETSRANLPPPNKPPTQTPNLTATTMSGPSALIVVDYR
ncbi:hypothetical protein ACFX2J_000390 [Malus domestica]